MLLLGVLVGLVAGTWSLPRDATTALSPRDQLLRNRDSPPNFSNQKELPCQFYSSRQPDCTRYDSLIALTNMQEMERYVNSQLKDPNGRIKRPDIWILIKHDFYWVNPARNKWMKFRKVVAPPRNWFSGGSGPTESDVDLKVKPASPLRPTPAPRPSGGRTIVANSIEKLGFQLWPACKSSDCLTNTIYSPMSISSMLTLLMFGSDGVTERELRSILGYAERKNDPMIQSSYWNIFSSRSGRDPDNQLSIANGIFTFNAKLKGNFVRDVKSNFTGHVQNLATAGNQAIDTINKWVADQTNNKINKVVTTLPPNSRMVAVNAVYFKGLWLEPFGTEFTLERDFFVSQREKIRVQTMISEFDVHYVEDSSIGCKMISLPYQNSQMAMYLVLPLQRHGLSEVENKLKLTTLENLVVRMQEKSVEIRLPKFRISQRISLKERLASLGVRDLFTPDLADLSRMIDGKAVVDDMVHEAFIRVSETGTEAAAATAVFLSRGTPSKSFVADQPFFFFIRDKSTKVVYFAGRVVRPNDAD